MKPIGNRQLPGREPAEIRQSYLPAIGPQKGPGPTIVDPACPPLPPKTQTMSDGGGLPLAVLDLTLRTARDELAAVAATPLPETATDLVAIYARLGHCIAEAEACLLSALDALDPRTGGGVASSTAAYGQVRARAFASWRDAGAQFARLEAAFRPIVHGPSGWPNQPLEVSPDRGDGRPLYHYLNTYKKPPGLGPEQRLAEHQERVNRFDAKGGCFEDLIVAAAGTFATLTPQLRYDYVMETDGTLRLAPNGPQGTIKPGHSLLAAGGPEFRDRPVLLAGELWVLQDTAGDVEAVVLANNSGHFKPSFEDLENALPHLEKLGLPREKVVLFGGPNNLPSMFAEIEERCGLESLSSALPPTSAVILDGLRNAGRALNPLTLRHQHR